MFDDLRDDEHCQRRDDQRQQRVSSTYGAY
jgi:hypothetical protein